jgi:hypothetical protein
MKNIGDSNIIFHEDITSKLSLYSIKNGILNTIFYGPPGSGKNYLVNTLISKILKIDTKEFDYFNKIHDANFNISYYTNGIYIMIDGYEIKNNKVNLGKFLEHVSRTQNVSTHSTKIIYIRYIDCLTEHHQSLRQLVEDSFTNTRFIFSCRFPDKIDSALLSRCIKIRVSSPSTCVLYNWQKKSIAYKNKSDLHDLIIQSNNNANTLIHMIYGYNIHERVENVNLNLAEKVYSVLLKKDSVFCVQELSETLFKSDISIHFIMKEYLKLLKKDKIRDTVRAIEYYLCTSSHILFHLSELFFSLSVILHAE